MFADPDKRRPSTIYESGSERSLALEITRNPSLSIASDNPRIAARKGEEADQKS
jgi:hypothetical protein